MPEQTSELQGVIDAINYATSQIGNAIGAYGDALKAEIEAENIATGAGLSTAAAADAIVAGKLLGAQSALIDGSISLTKSGAALIAGDKLGAIDEALNGATSIYTGAAGAATGAELGLLLGGPVGAAVGAVLGYASASLIGRSDYNFLKTLTSYIYFGKGFSWTPANWARGFLPTIFFDPLVVNLTGNGAPNLTNVDSSTTTFDYFGNGFKTQTGWIGAGSGLLAYDPSGTGNITAANLLGSPTQSGVDALRALDSNGDGVINSSDPAYASLGVWIDANGDGVSQPGEFQSLASLGITSINLNFATTGNLTVNDNGNQILSTASYSLSNGNAGSISEVNFQVNTTNSTFTPPAGFTLDPATAALPELKGSGNVLDLATAMTLDPKLKAMVQAVNDNESNVLLKQYKNYRGNCNG